MLRNIGKKALVHLQQSPRLPNILNHARHIHCNICLRNPRHPTKSPHPGSAAIASKYKVITEEEAPLIRDIYEEMNYESEKYPMISDEFDGINLQRGKTGVFDIEDLVSLLQRENAKNIFVATVPKEINYVDYICVVSGRSKRHILALAEFVRKVFKKKCWNKEPIPNIEGKSSNEWMALDLGNIALHIFSEKAREVYDLETLWSVGPEFDELFNKKESADIFENYSNMLKDLKPLS